MAAFDVIGIAGRFGLTGISSVKELTAGHINASYKVETDRGAFLVQRVNTSIFSHPERMMENIALVLSSIPQMGLVCALDGRPYYSDETGFYRVYGFVEDSVSYDRIESEDMAYRMGAALRSFHTVLADISGEKLYETIPRFHDMDSRFAQFEDALSRDAAGRAASVSHEISFMGENKERAVRISRLYASGVLPSRVTHNDAKLQNVLFSRCDGSYITFVDLDTVMPGTLLFDTGDMIRSGASTAEEDEKDLSLVRFSPEYLSAMVHGYLDDNPMLTAEERSLFAESGRTITFIMALRFLTDYINGDVYYRTDYPEHNLVRARNQIRLIENMDDFFGKSDCYDISLILK